MLQRRLLLFLFLLLLAQGCDTTEPDMVAGGCDSSGPLGESTSNIETWGTPVDAPGQFKDPGGLGLDERGFAYVADKGNSRIQKLDPDGNTVALWPLDFVPTALDATPDGEVAALGMREGNAVLVYLDCTGEVRWQTAVNQWASDVGVGPDGTVALVVRALFCCNVQTYSRTGSTIASWRTDGYPRCVTVDREGSVHVIEQGSEVEEVSWEVFADDGTLIRTSPVPVPGSVIRGIDIDPLGHAYIVSWQNTAEVTVLNRQGRLVAGPLDLRAYDIRDAFDIEIGTYGRFLVSVHPGEVFEGVIDNGQVREIWHRGDRGSDGFVSRAVDLAAGPSGRVAVAGIFGTTVFRSDGVVDWVTYEGGLVIALDQNGDVYLGRQGGVTRVSKGGTSHGVLYYYPVQTPPHCEVFVPRALATTEAALFVAFGWEFRFSCPFSSQPEVGCGVLRVSGGESSVLIPSCFDEMTSTPSGDLLLLRGNTLSRYGEDGTLLGSVALEIDNVGDLASIPGGNLYVSSPEGIYELSATGSVIRSVEIPDLRTASPPIATDPSGVLFVLDVAREVVYRIPPGA